MPPINPGIRKTVEWLNSQGFPTVDSGDGETHDYTCDRDYPYVTIRVVDYTTLIVETERLLAAIKPRVAGCVDVGFDGPSIQASYDPVNHIALIDLMHVTDKLLGFTDD